MSGKPSAAKPKPAPAKPAPAKKGADPAKAAAVAPGAAKSNPVTRSAPAKPAPDAPADDDNPFGVDVAALQKAAVPISPKPTKQRTVEIKCPMCETVGYIAPQHQGKDVKCSNPDCKFPIFMAPKAKKVAVADPNAGGGRMSAGKLGAIGVAAAIAIGAGVYFMFFAKPTTVDAPEVVIPKQGPTFDPKDLDRTGGKRIDTTPSTGPQIQAAALKDIQLAAAQRDNSRSPAMARAWAAEAFAVAGQAEQAKEQIQLSENRADSAYYRVTPLLRLFLLQRGTPAAEETLKAIQTAASGLPQSARTPVDAATAGAAAMVIAGRLPDAEAIMGRPITESRGIQSLYWTAATFGDIFDFDAVVTMPAWLAAAHPQREAVTWAVSSFGERDKALAWAKSASSLDVREACVGVWSARQAHDAATAADAVPHIEAAISDLQPSGRARAWANFAYGRFARGDTSGATDALAKAEAALAEIPQPVPMETPSLETIYYSKGRPRAGLPETDPGRSAAVAAATIARVHFAAGERETGSQRLAQAIAFAQSIAPSQTVTEQLVVEADTRRRIEQKLDAALNLRGDSNKKFQAANQYITQVGILNEEGIARSNLVRAILRDAADAGFAAAAWNLAVTIATDSNALRQDPTLTGDLPGFIALRAYATGDSATGAEIESKVPKSRLTPDKIDEIAFRMGRAIDDKQTASIAAELKRVYQEPNFDQNRMDVAVLRAAAMQTRASDALGSLQFIRDIPDPAVREDALWLLAASLEGKPLAVLWKAVSTVESQRRMSATERAALDRGFVAGTALAAPQEETAAASKATP